MKSYKLRSRVLKSLTLIFLLALVNPQAAWAHQVGFDGGMAAALHFSDDNRPVAGQPTEISLIELKYRNLPFDPEKCECRLTISRGSKNEAAPKLTARRGILSAEYIFPAAGAYTLIFSGEPAGGNYFDPFRITYTQSVSRAAKASGSGWDTYLVIGLLLILAAGAVLVSKILRTGAGNDKVQE